LDSVLLQTLTDFECIIIDDASTDESTNIIKKYAKIDKRIKPIYLEQNVGAAVARNHGLKIAKGEYLGFVDSDDFIDSDFYEKLYSTAYEHDSDIAMGNVIVDDATTGQTKRIDKLIELINESKYRFTAYWWAAIYRKELITKHNIDFPADIISSQDICFLIPAVVHSNKVATCPDTFYHYKRRHFSLSDMALTREKVESHTKMRMTMLDFINNANITPDGYRIIYINLIMGFFNTTLPWNTNHNVRIEIIKNALKFYKQSKYPDITKPELRHVNMTLQVLLESDDAEGLLNYTEYSLSKEKQLRITDITKYKIIGIPFAKTVRIGHTYKLFLFGICVFSSGRRKFIDPQTKDTFSITVDVNEFKNQKGAL